MYQTNRIYVFSKEIEKIPTSKALTSQSHGRKYAVDR